MKNQTILMAGGVAVAIAALFMIGVEMGKRHERVGSLAAAMQSEQGANEHINDLSIAYDLNKVQLSAEDRALTIASGGHIKNTPLIEAVYVTGTSGNCIFKNKTHKKANKITLILHGEGVFGGALTNNTDRVCESISAVFGLYNDDGTKRGQETEDIRNLAPMRVWRFELDRENMLYHNPKLEELTWILEGETKVRSKKFK